MTSIADVAVGKQHQRLDEIFIFFTRTILEISKVVYKKTQSVTFTFITSQGIKKQGKGLQDFSSDIALSAAILIFLNTVCVATLA